MAFDSVFPAMATRGRAATMIGGVVFFLVAAFAGAHPFVKFGYAGQIGPEAWGNLSPDYSMCAKGSRQSPIDIVKKDAVVDGNLKPLDRDYPAANATLVDNGFNIMLKYDGDAGTLVIDGKSYTLKQMHWHTPSEHTLDGVRYPLELHLVHAGDDGSISVVSILYQYGHPDPFLYGLKEKVAELSKEVCGGDEEAHVPVGVVEMRAFRRHSRRYYRYVGSLTTPPCTENVVWTILGKVREITEEQTAALRSILGAEFRNNSRPVQPLNGRQVQVCYD